MDNETTMIRRQSWLQIINECNSRPSGTKKDWCTDNGVDIRKFYYWQRHLREIMNTQMSAFADQNEILSDLQDSESSGMHVPFADVTSMLSHDSDVRSADFDKNQAAQNTDIEILIGDCHILLGDSIQEENLIKVIRSIRNA